MSETSVTGALLFCPKLELGSTVYISQILRSNECLDKHNDNMSTKTGLCAGSVLSVCRLAQTTSRLFSSLTHNS